MTDYRKEIEPNKLSNQRDFLTKAIGYQLLEIERFFVTNSKEFLEDCKGLYQEVDYFAFNLGATEFWFNGNLNQAFRFYSAGAPIIRFPGVYRDLDDRKYELSKMKHLASERLKNCLGQVCEDVRIWTYSESAGSIRNLEREKEGGWLTPEEFEQEIEALEKETKERGEEITDSGVSYLLANGEEIIYCCNFYDGSLSPLLLFVQDLHQEYIHSCFSLVQNKFIVEPKKLKFK